RAAARASPGAGDERRGDGRGRPAPRAGAGARRERPPSRPGRRDAPRAIAAQVVGRLKSLADLLVYRTDVPQEGRVPAARSPIGVELRVATYPTLFGERVALRLDAPEAAALGLQGLGLAPAALADLRAAIDRREGAVLLTGPSGSGKTTTLYACVRHLVEGAAARSIVTIED